MENLVKTAEQFNAEYAKAASRYWRRIRQERAAARRVEGSKQHPFRTLASLLSK